MKPRLPFSFYGMSSEGNLKKVSLTSLQLVLKPCAFLLFLIKRLNHLERAFSFFLFCLVFPYFRIICDNSSYRKVPVWRL